MSKLNSPDGYVSEVKIKTQSGTRIIRAGKDGRYNTDNPAVVSALKQAGFKESGIIGGVMTGYFCHSGGSRTTSNCKKCGRKRTVCTTKLENSEERCNNIITPCECDTIPEE